MADTPEPEQRVNEEPDRFNPGTGHKIISSFGSVTSPLDAGGSVGDIGTSLNMGNLIAGSVGGVASSLHAGNLIAGSVGDISVSMGMGNLIAGSVGSVASSLHAVRPFGDPSACSPTFAASVSLLERPASVSPAHQFGSDQPLLNAIHQAVLALPTRISESRRDPLLFAVAILSLILAALAVVIALAQL